MTEPVLTYFDFPGGRGEASRLALHLSGIAWTDDRVASGWKARKPETPFGGLPTLAVPGKGVLSQSNAILNYIGRTYGLLPEDPWEAARHDAMMNAIEHLRAEAQATTRPDEDAKRAAREAFAVGYLATWLGNASQQVVGPFLGGDALSVADLKLYIAMRGYQKGVYDYIAADVLEPFPKIVALCAAVAADPRVAEWESAA